MYQIKRLAVALVLGVWGSQGLAQPKVGPSLAVAANFSQGWRPDILDGTAAIPVLDFRDTVHWNVVEKEGGRFDFRSWRAAFPGILRARDLDMSLFVNAFHPAYDGGDTAYTEAAVAAFGTYAARTVARYSNIRSVEVGNEFNGNDFVSGPVRTPDLEARAGYYVALLKSVYRQVKAVNPDIRIVGGGVHSIPVGYLAMTYDKGAAAYTDALALHTYDTPPEHLLRQINVLRRLPEAKTIPIEVTEFGTLDAAGAPGFLLRNYCQMALSGVDRAVWYPMHPRGDGLVPVVDDAGAPTQTGLAYKFAQSEFAGLSVEAFNPDPFTYGCLFDRRKLVIWGEPRTLRVSPSLSAFTATGLAVDQDELALSATEPLIFLSEHPIDPTRDLYFAPQPLRVDSYHQLEFPLSGSAPDQTDWQNSILLDGTERPLQTMPGQERQGVPWVPYLGHSDFPDLRLTAEFLVPTQKDGKDVTVVQSYTASQSGPVAIDAQWKVSGRSEDGIRLTISLNETPVAERTITDKLHIKNRHILLEKGDNLRFTIGPNGTPWGDYTEHRIRLSAEIPDQSRLLTAE